MSVEHCSLYSKPCISSLRRKNIVGSLHLKQAGNAFGGVVRNCLGDADDCAAKRDLRIGFANSHLNTAGCDTKAPIVNAMHT